MKYTENALNLLTAKTFKNIGDAWIANNWDDQLSNQTLIELLRKTAKEDVNEDIFLKVKEHIKEKFEKLGNSCDGVTALGDPDFPEYRGNVKPSDRPNVLFYKGNLDLLSKKNINIAVIGVLTPNEKIEQDERKVVDLLSKENAVIVSGLALGCDRIAHHQALKSKSTTVAILPTPLNNIIPRDCIPLATYIGENGGLLLSEYYDEPKSHIELSGRFIKRDRLQALFSDMVILTASYTPDSIDPNTTKVDSGSRHAMAKAMEYGIKRGVIYNSYNDKDPKYDLNRQIISEKPSSIVIDPSKPEKTISDIFDSLKNIDKNVNKGEQCNLFK
ncbi:DNA-processing protein DprA [Neisseria lisongii]|uniref:DNA-protecting protein DprA n=1 Tax=Neisseria lisongii TaxID=2912188 RepID=A0AAW5AT78_9NEIS|nr:DNA-processing protein DprA [Neisseria lisongii]MCF7530588.1 DNA-protecting protein DprA [Neisseria lisongii]